MSGRPLRVSFARGHRRPMLQAPTGFGKTLTTAHIIQRALDKGKRVAFAVPALSLIDQIVAAFEAEGRGHATLRGYNDGWAPHKYRERFGVWPNDPSVRCARPAPPSLKTKNWLVSRQIAFAETRAAHG
jgi:Type III restriction enzyme, res subunit